MTLAALLEILAKAPLIASVQAPPESPVSSPNPLCRLAQASLMNGVSVLRLQGIDNIAYIHEATLAPTIGLIKKDYRDSKVYITPTLREVEKLIDTGCEVIALDGTQRRRPSDQNLPDLIAAIQRAGKLAMADCDTLESAQYAERCGADLIGTTLAGYTQESSPSTPGPDLELLRRLVAELKTPVIAEGRYARRWQVEAALRIGASAVVVGGALNDPFKTTVSLLPRVSGAGEFGAVDIGGTWLRYARFGSDGGLIEVQKTPLPQDRDERMAWVRQQVLDHHPVRVGVGTGGTVDPKTGIVWEAKPIIPEHQGSEFSEAILGAPTIALNDGLATAWGHAWHPRFAGQRVASLALGTGVGCGFVAEGSLMMGPRGEYPRINDIPTRGGVSMEDLLGGATLTPNPTDEDRAKAEIALESAVQLLKTLYYPDRIVVCGGVGLSDWLLPQALALGCEPSPYGAEAGLFGAAALAMLPPA